MPDDDDKGRAGPVHCGRDNWSNARASHFATSAGHCGDGRGNKNHDRAGRAEFIAFLIADPSDL
jgi:hypothetical protein